LIAVAGVLTVISIRWLVPDEVKQEIAGIVSAQKTALNDMGELNDLLIDRVKAECIQVGESHIPGEGNDHLTIEIMNPELEDESDAGRRQAAYQIAVFAANNYAGLQRIGTVVVFFISQVRLGVTMTHSEPFDFPLEDLLKEGHAETTGDGLTIHSSGPESEAAAAPVS